MRRILMIEDDDAIVYGLSEFLGEEGFLTESAGSLRELETINVEKYCLILLDLGLPDGDGWTFLARHVAGGNYSSAGEISSGVAADAVSAGQSWAAAGVGKAGQSWATAGVGKAGQSWAAAGVGKEGQGRAAAAAVSAGQSRAMAGIGKAGRSGDAAGAGNAAQSWNESSAGNRAAVPPVIILTARDGEADIMRGLDMGADDYVTKPFQAGVLLSRIRAVLRRQGKHPDEEHRLFCGGICLNRDRTEVTVDGRGAALTAGEYRLLLYFMENQGRTLTRNTLLAHFWDDGGEFVNDNTLTVTVRRLREKLGKDAGRTIRTVRGIGYRMEACDD